MARKYRMALAPVPNLDIPARIVLITEVQIVAGVWMLVSMEEVG